MASAEWVKVRMHPESSDSEMPIITGLLAKETDRFFILAQYVTHWTEEEINGKYVEIPVFSDPEKDPIKMLNKDYIVEVQILKRKPEMCPVD